MTHLRTTFALALLTLVGCAPEIGGRASFPVLSKSSLPGYEPVTTVDEKRCSHFVLFLAGWGEDPNHEALITDLLEQYKGDAIADANLTFFSIPAFFYNQSCARVKGTIVRKSGGGAPPPAAPGAPPAGPPPVQPAQPSPVSKNEVPR